MMLLTRGVRVAPARLIAPSWSAPSVIDDAAVTANGSNVFSGNWRNTSYSSNGGAALRITATQPVIIENSRFEFQRYGIQNLVNGGNLTVRNCLFYGRNTTQAGSATDRSIDIAVPASLVIENNTMIGAGILVNQVPASGSTSLVRVRYNRVLNIDGRLSDGAGGYVFERSNEDGESVYYTSRQFFQVNYGLFDDIDVSWNEVVNSPFVSRVEDTISLINAAGRVAKHINIHDNFIFGGSPTRPYDITFSGCGITLEGTTQYVDIDDNQVVGYDNTGIGLASGSNVNIRRNRLVSWGRAYSKAMLGRNRPGVSRGAGSQYVVISDNGTSWMDSDDAQAVWYITNGGNTGNSETGTYSLSGGGPTTAAHESAEWAAWIAKKTAAGVVCGSNLVL